MSNNKKNHENEELLHVQEALSASEAFIEKYYKEILMIIGVFLVVVVSILLFRNYYYTPRENEASEKMIVAVQYFERDSFQLALNGDGVNSGLIEIIDEYGITKSAELASAYAGVCYFQLGQYKEAIEMLKDFDGKSVNITPAITGLIGDCYVETENYKEAISYFEKAAKEENLLTSPIYLKKAGLAYEALGDYKKAEACYTTIKEKYFDSQVAMEMDKYIERAKALQNN